MTGISRTGIGVKKEFIERHPRVLGKIERGPVKQTNPKVGITPGLNNVRLVHSITGVERYGDTIANSRHRTGNFFNLADDLSRRAGRGRLCILSWRVRQGERLDDFCRKHRAVAGNQIGTLFVSEIIEDDEFLAIRPDQNKVRS